MSKKVLIKGGRVIDPAAGVDEVTDVLIEDARVRAVGKTSAKVTHTIGARGMIVTPGLIDMHVHLREPGDRLEETVESGARSAVAGGFTSIACMANTDPPIDVRSAAEFIRIQAERAGYANVFPVCACTKERRGEALSEMGGLVAAGAVGFSDDGDHVADAGLMRKILEYAKMLDKPILSHCEDKSLSKGGVMHEGAVSVLLGLPGMPAAAEEIAVARDIALAEISGARLHIMHVSAAGTVDLVRRAKARGVNVTAEAAPHHFTLTDDKIRGFDTNFKMSPPLRAAPDVEAVRKGLADGTIDCIASDHAPHTHEEKEVDFVEAPFGVIGMESLLPVALTVLVDSGTMPIERVVACLTANPARILGIERGTLAPGSVADVTIFDPSEVWTIDASTFESASRNCPFDGMSVKGRVTHVLVAGEMKYPFER